MGELTLDLLVLGGWWGPGGQKEGELSTLLLGLRNQHHQYPQEQQDQQQQDGKSNHNQSTLTFTTIAKVSQGLSSSDIEWIKNHHNDQWIPFDRNSKTPPPWWINFGPIGIDDQPEVFIRPEDSFIVQVKCNDSGSHSGFVDSEGKFGSGFTLRLPEVVAIKCVQASQDGSNQEKGTLKNSDGGEKAWDMWSGMSIPEFQKLIDRIQKEEEDDDTFSSQLLTGRKKRKPNPRHRTAGLSPAFSGQNPHIAATTNLLRGRVFYVIRGNKEPEHSKASLERLIVENGGDFRQMVLPHGDEDTIVISSSERIPQAIGAIKKGRSIVKPEWLLESVKAGKILPLIKELVAHANDEVKNSKYYNATLASLADKSVDSQSRKGQEDDGEEEEEDDDGNLGAERAIRNPVAGENTLQTETEPMSKPSAGREDEGDLRISGSDTEDDAEDDAHVIQYSPKVGATDDAYEEGVGDDGSVTEDEDEDEKQDDTKHHEGKTPSPADDATLDSDIPRQTSSKTGDANINDNTFSDEAKMFSHIVFYIGNSENAAKNGLETPADLPSTPTTIQDELAETARQLIENGGTATDDLTDPRLTHIVQYESDTARFKQIQKALSIPSRKHVIVVSHLWVADSLENGSILSEKWYEPGL